MFSGEFKRSSRFGLIGVLVVMALVAVIGLTMGSGEANPKLALGLIFGVLAVFVVVVLLLQRSDLERAAVSDAVDQPDLWTELAIHPIDADAILPRDRPRRRARPGLRADGPGDQREDDRPELEAAAADVPHLAPGIGLKVTARPKGGFEPRGPTMPGFDYRLRGTTELSGERHGRRVTVRFGGHEDAGHSEVEIAVPCNPFEAKSKRVEVRSGPEGLVISRRKAAPDDWLRDLWAAEKLLAD